MKKIFYEKVGRRYIPVYEYNSELLDAFSEGTHLVMCYPGGSSRRYNIDPDYAAMIAAGRVAENAISNAITEASEFKPSKKPATAQQQQAWQALKDAYGDEFFTLEGNSINDCVRAGICAMQTEADKLLNVPAVRDAYEHFLLLCKLAKQSEQ